jgi:hypothetical protein
MGFIGFGRGRERGEVLAGEVFVLVEAFAVVEPPRLVEALLEVEALLVVEAFLVLEVFLVLVVFLVVVVVWSAARVRLKWKKLMARKRVAATTTADQRQDDRPLTTIGWHYRKGWLSRATNILLPLD